jgi:hypothetical protein
MRYKTRKNRIEVTDLKSNQRGKRKAKLLFRTHRFFKSKKKENVHYLQSNRLQAYSSDSDDPDYDSIFERST